jgi:hypothetical protein
MFQVKLFIKNLFAEEKEIDPGSHVQRIVKKAGSLNKASAATGVNRRTLRRIIDGVHAPNNHTLDQLGLRVEKRYYLKGE